MFSNLDRHFAPQVILKNQGGSLADNVVLEMQDILGNDITGNVNFGKKVKLVATGQSMFLSVFASQYYRIICGLYNHHI